MIRILSLSVVALVACTHATSEPPPTTDPGSMVAEPVAGPPPTPFETDEGLSGYRDAEGEIVIPATYSIAMPFTGEVAAVAGEAGWVFIDRTGKLLAHAFVFDNGADEFVEDRARIVEAELYGFIASSGEIAVAPTWSFALPFSGGLAAVCTGCVREADGEHFTMTGGTWGYVDPAGVVVIPARFEQAGPFVDGRAAVREGGRTFEIGTDGAELAP